MGFSIIKMETRLANMVAWFAGSQSTITDLLIGGVTRTKFEAFAVEMEAQDYQFYVTTKKAIPVAVYSAFGFVLLPATTANGYVTFSSATPVTANVIIPAGTKVATGAASGIMEKVYATSASVTLAVGQSQIDAPVTSLTPGTAGNINAATLTVIKTPVNQIVTVTNAAAINNGTNPETEASRQSRFRNFIASISRGTAAAIAYGATTAEITNIYGNVVERVVDAKVLQPPITADSHFTVYVWNGSGVASADLVARAQDIIDGYLDAEGTPVPGYKAAGDVASVVSATVVIGNVTIEILAFPGADQPTLEILVSDTLTYYIQSIPVGQNFVLNEAIKRVKGLPGVDDLNITAYPDAELADGQVLIPGVMTVEFS